MRWKDLNRRRRLVNLAVALLAICAVALHRDLKAKRTTPVIPGTRSRKRPVQYDQRRYRDRWRVEAAFCRLKDFRRVATRYDKLAANFASAVALAAVIAEWAK